MPLFEISFISVFAGCCATFLLFVLYTIYSKSAPVVSHVPGPPAELFWGHLKLLKKNVHRLHDWRVEMNEKYGAEKGLWYMSLAGFPGVEMCVSDPDIVEHMFVTKFQTYQKQMLNTEFDLGIGKEFFGNGIFSSDGAEWRKQRKLYSYMFSLTNLRKHMYSSFDRLADNLLEKVGHFADSKASFDIQDLFGRTTIDGIADIAFGEDVGAVKADTPPPFVKAFDRTQQHIVNRGRNPFWKFQRFFNYGTERGFSRDMNLIRDFVHGMIRRIRDGDYDPSRFNIVAHTIKRFPDITDEELKDVIMSFTIAGRDTTACAMTWIIYELTQHPDVYAKVVEEIDGLESFDYDSIDNKMPFTEMVFFESQRLHPSVPSDTKIAVKDDMLPNGIKIKRGTRLNFNPYGMGRNKKVWGEDALEFKPERFKDGDKVYGEYKFPMFNVGQRLCLGKTMAILESKKLIAHLLKNFDIELVKGREINYQVTILLWVKDGLHVIAKHR